MTIDQFSLSQLSHPVDLMLFWGMILSIGQAALSASRRLPKQSREQTSLPHVMQM